MSSLECSAPNKLRIIMGLSDSDISYAEAELHMINSHCISENDTDSNYILSKMNSAIVPLEVVFQLPFFNLTKLP